MGLDVAELMMQVEDEFEVQIPNDQWWRIRTVSDLCTMVATLANPKWQGLCRHPRAFCTLRRALMQMGYKRATVRTRTQLRQLIPRHQLQATWRKLSQTTAYVLPDLQRPTFVVVAAVVLHGFLCFMLLRIAFVAQNDLNAILSLFVLLVSFPVLGMLLPWLTRPMANQFPRDCQNVGDLVRWVVRHNTVSETAEQYFLTGEQHFERVRAIVSDQLNIPAAEIHLHSRFIEDLKAG